jgi:hypothetical protein
MSSAYVNALTTFVPLSTHRYRSGTDAPLASDNIAPFDSYLKIEAPERNEASNKKRSFLFVLNFVAIKLISSTFGYWQFDFMFLVLFWSLSELLSLAERFVFVYFALGKARSLFSSYLCDIFYNATYVSRIVIFAYIGTAIYSVISSDQVTAAESVVITFTVFVVAIASYWVAVRNAEESKKLQSSSTPKTALPE